MVEGWIKLHRKFIHWEWYDDPNVVRLFLHCLLLANHEDKSWRGNEIKRGSFITSYGKLSKALNLSVKQIRLALNKLESTNEIERKTTNKSTTIIVCNYNTYQDKKNKKDKQRASKGQAKGKQRATTKNDKNDKNDKNGVVTTIVDDVPNASNSETWYAAMRIANRLLESICDYDPTHRYNSNPPSISNWVKDIDRALRLDGRTEQQFNFIIDSVFYNSNKFPDLWDKWALNIQSGSTLRDKFDNIKNQIKTSHGKSITNKIAETEKFLNSYQG